MQSNWLLGARGNCTQQQKKPKPLCKWWELIIFHTLNWLILIHLCVKFSKKEVTTKEFKSAGEGFIMYIVVWLCTGRMRYQVVFLTPTDCVQLVWMSPSEAIVIFLSSMWRNRVFLCDTRRRLRSNISLPERANAQTHTHTAHTHKDDTPKIQCAPISFWASHISHSATQLAFFGRNIFLPSYTVHGIHCFPAAKSTDNNLSWVRLPVCVGVYGKFMTLDVVVRVLYRLYRHTHTNFPKAKKGNQNPFFFFFFCLARESFKIYFFQL